MGTHIGFHIFINAFCIYIIGWTFFLFLSCLFKFLIESKHLQMWRYGFHLSLAFLHLGINSPYKGGDGPSHTLADGWGWVMPQSHASEVVIRAYADRWGGKLKPRRTRKGRNSAKGKGEFGMFVRNGTGVPESSPEEQKLEATILVWIDLFSTRHDDSGSVVGSFDLTAQTG